MPARYEPAIAACSPIPHHAIDRRPGAGGESRPRGMSCNVAINGLGRIGRAILRLVIDQPGLDLVAVNDLVDVENLVRPCP
jgi:hypothetical protein